MQRSQGAARFRRMLALLAVLGLVLGACGNSGDDEEASDSAADTTGADTTDDGTDESTAPTTTETDDSTAPTSEAEFVPLEGVPGVTDDEIRYAAFGTAAGSTPNATCALDCFVHGVEAYFAMVNDAGGVHGRQLVLDDPIDDELANNQVKALEIIEADDTFGIFSYALLATGFPDIAKAKVPLYTSVVSSPETEGQETSFALPGGQLCIQCASKSTPYIASELGATKVASIGYGVAAASKDCVTGHVASFEKYGEGAGVELVYSNDELAFGLPNGLAPEVTAMKDAGVELVLTCVDKNGAQTLAQELQRQGMPDVVVVVPEGYHSPTFFEQSGGLFEGDLMVSTSHPFEANPEGTALPDFEKWLDETGHADTEIQYAMWGWLAADTAVAGLEAAGPEFSREKVVAATNKLEDYTAGGLMPPVDWGRQHQAPTPDDPVTNAGDPLCSSYVMIGADDWELIGDPDKPFLCWDPKDSEKYTEPEAMTFAES